MMKFKPLTTEAEWLWLKDRTHVILCEDAVGVVAYDGRGIQGICLADSFTTDACNVHIALDSVMSIRSGLLREFAVFVFIQNNRKRMFGLVPADNSKARKFDEHIGFKEVARVPHALGEGRDYIVMCMTRSECRWLPEEMREAA